MEKIRMEQTSDGVILDINVKPNSKQFRLVFEPSELQVFCRETPVKGKANKELTKELTKVFKKQVAIISGFTSKKKKILIKNLCVDEVNEVLSAYVQE